MRYRPGTTSRSMRRPPTARGFTASRRKFVCGGRMKTRIGLIVRAHGAIARGLGEEGDVERISGRNVDSR
jgi:hypothetical protein